MSLAASKTLENLKAAFAGESQANRRYLYFAQKADVEGYNDVAAVFRSTAEGETGHAHGHLEFMEEVGDPATGLPIGGTENNLKASIAGETHEYTDMYPGMARTAREEGFDEIADWFETLAKAEKSHAGRFQRALELHGLRLTGRPSSSGEGRSSAANPRGHRTQSELEVTMADTPKAPAREGSLDAPFRHPIAWQDEAYYDLAAVEKEMERQFDICHTCRRCFNLCDSFPRLFDLIDESKTGELDSVAKADYAKVDEACTLCDMCFLTKCPYVPPHEFDIDIPHLILRYRAAKRRAGERDFVRDQLGQTDRNGKMAKPVAKIANWATARKNTPLRKLLEAIAQIDAEVELPKYHSKTATDLLPTPIAPIRPARPLASARSPSTPPVSSTTTPPTRRSPPPGSWPSRASRPSWSIRNAAACPSWNRATSAMSPGGPSGSPPPSRPISSRAMKWRP